MIGKVEEVKPSLMAEDSKLQINRPAGLSGQSVMLTPGIFFHFADFFHLHMAQGDTGLTSYNHSPFMHAKCTFHTSFPVFVTGAQCPLVRYL